jgi:hypothetical protein
VEKIDLDNQGARAWSTCMVWALEVVHCRYENNDFPAPIHKEMAELINDCGDGLSRLYAQEYQVLPYIYTHLVSSACAMFLLGHAFLKGLYFDVDASYTFGLVLPCCSIFLMAMTVLGLLQIGSLLANPLGPYRESFAICHFVNYTCSTSLDVVSVEAAPMIANAMRPEGGNAAFTDSRGKDGGQAAIERVRKIIDKDFQLLKTVKEEMQQKHIRQRLAMHQQLLDDLEEAAKEPERVSQLVEGSGSKSPGRAGSFTNVSKRRRPFRSSLLGGVNPARISKVLPADDRDDEDHLSQESDGYQGRKARRTPTRWMGLQSSIKSGGILGRATGRPESGIR